MKTWLLRYLMTPCVVALLPAVSLAADAKTKKKDPPGTELILGELRAWFKTYANKDNNTIGKVEAAKAFAYKQPYDAAPAASAPAAKPKDDDNPGSSSTDKPGDKGGDNTKYAKRLDYQFIAQLDKNNDEKVSQDEFEIWAHDYAVKAAEIQELELKLAEAEAKKQNQQAKHHQNQLNQLKESLRGFEAAIHAAHLSGTFSKK